jgi:hypothetical protein
MAYDPVPFRTKAYVVWETTNSIIHSWVRHGKIITRDGSGSPKEAGECCQVLPGLFGMRDNRDLQITTNETIINNMRMLSGPNGWTVYKMLKARQDVMVMEKPTQKEPQN